MSVAFTEYATGGKTALSISFPRLLASLEAVGLRPADDPVIVTSYDPELEGFADARALSRSAAQLMASGERLDDYPGLCVSCARGPDRLDFRLVNHGERSHCLLEMPARTLYRLFRAGEVGLLRRLLAIGPDAICAVAGLGAMELDWEPLSVAEVVRCWCAGTPGYQGSPPPVAVVTRAACAGQPGVAERLAAIYDPVPPSPAGRQVLFRRGVALLYASLAS